MFTLIELKLKERQQASQNYLFTSYLNAYSAHIINKNNVNKYFVENFLKLSSKKNAFAITLIQKTLVVSLYLHELHNLPWFDSAQFFFFLIHVFSCVNVN
jgi:hypothetical protein